MRTEPFGTASIERYLRTRKIRYFRGQHDGEYFFISTVDRQRLHVHLEVAHAHVMVRVTPTYFFPAADRAQLQAFADGWANAIIHESSDPNRIGVVMEYSRPVAARATFEDFSRFVDDAINSAVQFFGALAPLWVLDAG